MKTSERPKKEEKTPERKASLWPWNTMCRWNSIFRAAVGWRNSPQKQQYLR